jgi:6-pyruvoyltetrahydropterin/6-carboxytetrahydropterin synthase
MINLTKIFHFEMAHAIHGYPGQCQNIHGHSYELHVTVSSKAEYNDYIPSPGFVIDFKDIKSIVKGLVIECLDHKLVLSQAFLKEYTSLKKAENLVIWKQEPTAENMLVFIQQILSKTLRDDVQLAQLKLYETKDSYAEWINDDL